MTTLIACVSVGKGTWGHVMRVMAEQPWTKIILVATQYAKDNFKAQQGAEYVVVDPEKPMQEITDVLLAKLNALHGEVAINIVSGTGKEHMALLSAVMKAGLAFRLIALTKEGVKEV